MGKYVMHTAYATGSLGSAIKILRRPDNLFPCCASFTPMGSCAHAPDEGTLRYMKRMLVVANEYLSRVSQERFEAVCMSEDPDPTDARCRP